MSKFVTDTMAYILHLEKRRMPNTTKTIFNNPEKGEAKKVIPSMVIAEIAYLSEKNKIDSNLDQVQNHIKNAQGFKEQPLHSEINKTSFEIDDIPELYDRLIAGTAKHLNCSLITNDTVIVKSKHMKTIWK